jgi:hypothetical protein
MESPRDVFEQLVPGVRGGDLERVLDRLFAFGNAYEGFAILDAVHASLLRDSREYSLVVSKAGLSYRKARKMADLLGRSELPDFMRVVIQGSGMSRLATTIATMGFALDQACIDLLRVFKNNAPEDDLQLGELMEQLPEPFTAYLVAPTAERLALSGWQPKPRSAAMTRREIYERATVSVWANVDAREKLQTQAKLAELLYGAWFDKAPGQ